VSLENFKKQAKLLVRWHRERNYSVGGRIRQLSHYEDLTDTEALALPFPLNEAQEIIALEQGYNSWAELKQGLKKAPKTIRRAPAALKLTNAMPVLYVSDVQAAAGRDSDQGLNIHVHIAGGRYPKSGRLRRAFSSQQSLYSLRIRSSTNARRHFCNTFNACAIR